MNSEGDDMTREERAAELQMLLESTGAELVELGYPTFHDFHGRATELMERDVWTHEFAFPDYLYHEILTGVRPSMDGIIAKLPADKPVIVVEPKT